MPLLRASNYLADHRVTQVIPERAGRLEHAEDSSIKFEVSLRSVLRKLWNRMQQVRRSCSCNSSWGC